MNCCHNKTEDPEEKNVTQEVSDIKKETMSYSQIVAIPNPWKAATLVVATALVFTLAFGVLWSTGVIQITGMNNTMEMKGEAGGEIAADSTVFTSIMPLSVDLPINWGNIGTQLLSTGVIDEQKFKALYESRGGMSDTMKKMLYETDMKDVVMTEENAQDMLNIFWAFGVANQNPILTEGPMVDEQYGGDPSRFAATGGWTLRTGDIMDHYSKHQLVTLTPEQQARVEAVSKGIFRPCCNNATSFPDCNHGMAMLGLLELLAANDVSEDDMYSIALGVNTYWFPSTYETIALFLDQKGASFDTVAPKDILGQGLSSGSGFQAVEAALAGPAAPQQGGGGCSV